MDPRLHELLCLAVNHGCLEVIARGLSRRGSAWLSPIEQINYLHLGASMRRMEPPPQCKAVRSAKTTL